MEPLLPALIPLAATSQFMPSYSMVAATPHDICRPTDGICCSNDHCLHCCSRDDVRCAATADVPGDDATAGGICSASNAVHPVDPHTTQVWPSFQSVSTLQRINARHRFEPGPFLPQQPAYLYRLEYSMNSF